MVGRCLRSEPPPARPPARPNERTNERTNERAVMCMHWRTALRRLRGLGGCKKPSAGLWAQPSHICTGTGLTPATSAPGLGSALPHLRRDWAHPATSAPGLGSPNHICTGTGLTPATSASGLGSPNHICTRTGLTPATSASGLASLRRPTGARHCLHAIVCRCGGQRARARRRARGQVNLATRHRLALPCLSLPCWFLPLPSLSVHCAAVTRIAFLGAAVRFALWAPVHAHSRLIRSRSCSCSAPRQIAAEMRTGTVGGTKHGRCTTAALRM
jgi:hypothetical protein